MKKYLLSALGIAGLCIAGYGAWNLVMNPRGAASVSIIGGADGPTSVFVAGKVGYSFFAAVTALGLVVLGTTLFFQFRKRK